MRASPFCVHGISGQEKRPGEIRADLPRFISTTLPVHPWSGGDEFSYEMNMDTHGNDFKARSMEKLRGEGVAVCCHFERFASSVICSPRLDLGLLVP